MSPAPACWTSEQARRIFVTEALEGSDAIFLATHSPIRGFEVTGTNAADIEGDDERAILDALSAEERGHAFCVVQGEPGSGKSHLIRWLSINWPESRDIKLLLRRADGSLEGALRQLKECLPSEFERLFEGLGQRQEGTKEGRINMFAVGLGATLEPTYFSKPKGDEDWCKQFAPADLIGFGDVRRAWEGPARILNLVDGAGGERNSAVALFDLFDIENLADACRYLKPTAVDARARDLARRLEREAEDIRRYREQDWRADELASEAPQLFETSLKLMAALNKRKNEAISKVIGVSAEGLKTLFRNVREALAPRGQRLVLLLEDITTWEGLDDSLMDVLIDNAEAAGGSDKAGVCPLISVVGVTPQFYYRIAPNVRQRITQEIKLGSSAGGLQDVAMIRESEDRRAFVARYLAAVRAGLPALEGWRNELPTAPRTPPPNACEGCSRQPACFKTFGHEEGVGLFPFTPHALDRFFEALKEDDHGQSWRTPRGLLQAVLTQNLVQADALEQSRFPVALIEATRAIREDRRSDQVLSNRLERIVANRIAEPDEEQRMRRMLSYWADPARAETTLVDGELAFAGAKRSVYEAFGLEWLGGESPGASQAIEQPKSPEADEPPALILIPDEDEFEEEAPPPTGPAWARNVNRPVRAPVIPPKPERLKAKRGELETYQHQLRNWAKGKTIENASFWNKLLYQLVRDVDPKRFGISRSLFDRLVTPERVKAEGSSASSRNYLTIDATPAVRDGLEAYLSLALEKGLSAADQSFHRRNLALLMRRLERMASDYVASRLPKHEDGRRFSPVVAIAQVLVARAWLRGTIAPDASVTDYMREILSDEDLPLSDPKTRSMPWQEYLTATDKWHDKLRLELRAMVSLSIDGGSGGAGLTDASELAGAIERIRSTGKADEVPSEGGSLPETLQQAANLASLWREKRIRIDQTEAQQLKSRSNSLFELLRGRSVSDHFARIDTVVSAVAGLMSHASPDGVANWKQAYAKLKPRIDEGAGLALEQLISNFDDEDEGLPVKAAPRLGWMAKVPAKDLAEFLELANVGEKLVGDLLAHVRDCVQEASGIGNLSEVHRIGSALKRASKLENQDEQPETARDAAE